jgi:hypothetical protein
MKVFGWMVLIVIGISVLFFVATVLGWFGRAADVVQQQIDPAVLLQKYSWFKDAAAQLDARHADIDVYQNRFKAIGGTLGTCPQGADRVTREQCLVWVQEVSGIIASYNDLAAEYNAQMAKWNYRFTNIGDMPKGADTALPREYRAYNYGQ